MVYAGPMDLYCPGEGARKDCWALGQVTQVVEVTHGQETLDVATYRFFFLNWWTSTHQPFKSELWEQPEIMK